MAVNIPDSNYVYAALLRCNYFPMVRKYMDEIPPVFSTVDFTPEVASDLCQRCAPRKKGYDQIEYRATRFNNITRLMQIPHPLPYARLCESIFENWDALNHVCKNAQSRIKPALHDDDRLVILGEYNKLDAGRLVVMEKEKFPESVVEDLTISIGARYRVSADISTCFPSIYTHSIPWALVGHARAKSNHSTTLWYNDLDKRQRDLKRGETHGIPIGPATSNLISEVILYKIDENLRDKGYRFLRFIDDYKCYCETREQAEQFLVDLERELQKYLLTINIKKVVIEELPIPHRASWIIDLVNHLPDDDSPSSRKIADFFDYAINLQKKYPEGSILKYTSRSLVKRINESNAKVFLSYLASVSFHYPIVLPILCEAAKNNLKATQKLDFSSILKQQLKYRRSDAVCWTLYLMGICGKSIDVKLAEDVIATKDCMSMAMLIAIDQHKKKVAMFLNDYCDPNSEYDCDRYWILIHELSKETKKFENYRKKSGLTLLRHRDVHFVFPINE